MRSPRGPQISIAAWVLCMRWCADFVVWVVAEALGALEDCWEVRHLKLNRPDQQQQNTQAQHDRVLYHFRVRDHVDLGSTGTQESEAVLNEFLLDEDLVIRSDTLPFTGLTPPLSMPVNTCRVHLCCGRPAARCRRPRVFWQR